jgi:hypothetical protein
VILNNPVETTTSPLPLPSDTPVSPVNLPNLEPALPPLPESRNH